MYEGEWEGERKNERGTKTAGKGIKKKKEIDNGIESNHVIHTQSLNSSMYPILCAAAPPCSPAAPRTSQQHPQTRGPSSAPDTAARHSAFAAQLKRDLQGISKCSFLK